MKIIYNSEEREIVKNETIKEVFKEEIEKSEIPIIGAKFNNEYQRLDYCLENDGTVALVNIATQGGMKIYRRTLTYIMGMAFWKLYPEARVVVNYQLTNAMYCNLENMKVTEEMLYNVQEEMKRIIEKDYNMI